MLEITGRFNGKDYKNDVVDAATIAKRFGIPEMPEEGDVLVLNSHRDLFGVNSLGSPRGPSSISAFTRYTIDNGIDSFQIRYFERKDGEGEKTKYSPYNLTFRGQAHPFNRKYYSLFVFMCLHPLTTTSPTFTRGHLGLFEYIDVKAEAAARGARMLRQSKLQNEIIGSTNDWNIIVRAKGLAVRGETCQLEQTNDVPTLAIQAKGELIRLLTKHGEAFEAAWADYTTHSVGVFRLAMDKNIIAMRPQSGGVRRGWYFVATDEMICPVGNNSSEFQELVTFSQAPGNEELVGKIQKLVDASIDFFAAATPSAEPPVDLENKIVDHLIEIGLIAYSKIENSVRMYNSTEDQEGTVIMDGTLGKEGRSKLIALIRSDKKLNARAQLLYKETSQ